MAIDLSGAQRLVEGFMLDSCVVTRDPDGTADDAWDEESGTYYRPALDTDEIYSGPCFSSFEPWTPSEEGGGYNVLLERRWLYTPVNAAQFLPGDKVVYTVTSANSDPLLDGRVFRVIAQAEGTYQAVRRTLVESPRVVTA